MVNLRYAYCYNLGMMQGTRTAVRSAGGSGGSMKRQALSILVMCAILSLMLPAVSHAWHRHHHGHFRPYYGIGAFAGGVIVGTAIARPWYYAPRPVYVYPPPPVVYYPAPAPVVPNQAYAYPDPAVAAAPPASTGSAGGQWVDVPGQEVNGQWVPPHRTWVPNSP